ncbi:MAG: hypothetical protein DME48_06960 [Verrucomicrobia bacterium]|nr:MAG: hypothetical protein DME48_06960 [Verrucomicrobiota bacterium]
MSFIAMVCLVSAIASGLDVRPNLDAARLLTGSFSFRTLVNGAEVGRSRIQIRRSAELGNYVFSNLVNGSFSQSWEAVTSPLFAPVSARLSFGQGSAARIAFELSYHDDRVTGFVIPRKEPSNRREVDEAIADDTVDQRIDWAAVMARKEYVEGQDFRFHVYDPEAGNSLVTVQIGKSETTEVPAGSFETVRVSYQIDKRGHTETYEVFITKKPPRFLVKEKFPNSSVTELVELTKPTSEMP